MRIRITLTPVGDRDLLALYATIGETAFQKVLKNALLAYSTGLPYYEPFELNDVNNIVGPVVIRVLLDNTKFARLVLESNSCVDDAHRSLYVKAIAKMILTPSIASFYKGSSLTDLFTPTTVAKKTPLQKAKQRKETAKKSKTVTKPAPTETAAETAPAAKETPTVESKPAPAPASLSMQDMMTNPEFMKVMAEQMAKMMAPATNVKEPEPEPVAVAEPTEPEGPTQVDFNSGLAGLFGQIGSE